MNTRLAQGINEERADVVRWMLRVLENGETLGTEAPALGDAQDVLYARVRVLREKLRATPKQKLTRPRVVIEEAAEVDGVVIGDREWRFVDGRFEHRDMDTGWRWQPTDEYDWDVEPDIVRLLADLLAHPTEEVEGE